MKKPRLLDLFCGAGGAGMGYWRAGFEVVGVDISPQPHYPFEFHQADAFDFLADHAYEFDVIHASPPCQGYSRTRHLPWLKGRVHPMLIPAVRCALKQTNKPYVIENVGDSPLEGLRLTGGHFRLPFRRLRVFESNVLLMAHDPLRVSVGKSGPMFGARLSDQHKALGIDSQAIPPEYTQFIGEQLLAHLGLAPVSEAKA